MSRRARLRRVCGHKPDPGSVADFGRMSDRADRGDRVDVCGCDEAVAGVPADAQRFGVRGQDSDFAGGRRLRESDGKPSCGAPWRSTGTQCAELKICIAHLAWGVAAWIWISTSCRLADGR